MRRFTVLIAVFFIVLAGGLGVVSVASAQVMRDNNAVVLISIDGFRHDYLELHEAPDISHIATQGVRAECLLLVYPAKTFPNHSSIITGKFSSNHGVVKNRYYATAQRQE